jgi:hypothetical protein
MTASENVKFVVKAKRQWASNVFIDSTWTGAVVCNGKKGQFCLSLTPRVIRSQLLSGPAQNIETFSFYYIKFEIFTAVKIQMFSRGCKAVWTCRCGDTCSLHFQGENGSDTLFLLVGNCL